MGNRPDLMDDFKHVAFNLKCKNGFDDDYASPWPLIDGSSIYEFEKQFHSVNGLHGIQDMKDNMYKVAYLVHEVLYLRCGLPGKKIPLIRAAHHVVVRQLEL